MNAEMQTVVSPNWLSRNSRRVIEVVAGHSIYAVFNFLCDHIIYVYIVYRFGLLVGGAIMTTFSLVQCASLLILYDRMKIDWVGAGSLNRMADLSSPAWWQRIVIWTMKHGEAAVFFALCVFQDPFITTAYFQKGRFDGIMMRDWNIFFASVLVSNFYWTLRSGAIAALLVGGWKWITKS